MPHILFFMELFQTRYERLSLPPPFPVPKSPPTHSKPVLKALSRDHDEVGDLVHHDSSRFFFLRLILFLYFFHDQLLFMQTLIVPAIFRMYD
jgi:hypothetical protein